MLVHLSIRNIVLIQSLDLEFSDGLTVLTGETGAGKSILLDALGLALGSRADFSLLRDGTDKASVTAAFDIEASHPVWHLLEEAGIEASAQIILRRQLRSDGKSPAHINDQPVSVNLLRQCGDMLVEIQGQFEGRGLLDITTHQRLLDRAGIAPQLLARIKSCWQEMQSSQKALQECQAAQAKAREEEEWLRDAVEQLDKLAPEAEEEENLSQERTRHAYAARIAEALQHTHTILASEDGVISAAGRAQSLLERQSEVAGTLLDEGISALERAIAELNEAEAQISQAGEQLDGDPERLAFIEDRLHGLRSAARKHRIEVDELPALHRQLASQLAALDDQSGQLASLAAAAEKAREAYHACAAELSDKRREIARSIDAQVMAELPPLKLEAAEFKTHITQHEPDRWGPLGWDRVRFVASTNPGMEMGAIDKIASGGELARFLLALKVVLARNESPKTLIFDEVDSGVGGAVAAAVGARLARLGDQTQTLVITHSPQVAGKGKHHLKIAKQASSQTIISDTFILDDSARIEEVARMLSGDEITNEARAAALNLLELAR
ncbi:MAG: DNA repair protein RecN [Candidatus Puniceispirillaceae bacterium]